MTKETKKTVTIKKNSAGTRFFDKDGNEIKAEKKEVLNVSKK